MLSSLPHVRIVILVLFLLVPSVFLLVCGILYLQSIPDQAHFGSAFVPRRQDQATNSSGSFALTATFYKDDLSTDLYRIEVKGDFWDIATKPTLSLAVNNQGILLSTTALKVVEEGSQSNSSHPRWDATVGYGSSLNVFTPYGFPFDHYLTPVFVIFPNTPLTLTIVNLKGNVPSGFIASFYNITYVTLNQPDARGTFLMFSIAMIRSTSSMLVSTTYAIIPTLSLYEVAALSVVSLTDPKERLTIYVGSLFSVFAYFLTLRQMLPPVLTYFETLITVGMLFWIIVEVVTFARRQLHPH